MDTKRIASYIAMSQEMRQLKAHVAALDKKLKVTQAEILDEMLEGDWESAKVGGITVSRMIRLSVNVKPEVGHTKAAEVMEEHGFGFLSKPSVHHQRLGSWYREMEDTEQEIPEEIMDVINVHNMPSVRCYGLGKEE